MAFPTLTTVIDDFNRANGPVYSGGGSTIWDTVPIVPGSSVLQVASNHLDGSVSGAEMVSLAQYGANLELYFDFSVATSLDSTHYLALFFAFQGQNTSSFSGYALIGGLTATANQWSLFKYTAGSGSNLGAFGTQAVSSGDSVGVEMIGSTIKAYYKPSAGSWSQIGSSITDSTYNRAGYIGFETGGAGDFDNLRGGSLVPNISGTSAGVGTTSGTVSTSSAASVSGTAAGSSSTSGVLSVPRPISGSASGSGALSGSLAVVAPPQSTTGFHRVTPGNALVRGPARIMVASMDQVFPTQIDDLIVLAAGASQYDARASWIDLGATKGGVTVGQEWGPEEFDVHQIDATIAGRPTWLGYKLTLPLVQATTELIATAWSLTAPTLNTALAPDEKTLGVGKSDVSFRRMALLQVKPDGYIRALVFRRVEILATQEQQLNYDKKGDRQILNVQWRATPDLTVVDPTYSVGAIIDQVP